MANVKSIKANIKNYLKQHQELETKFEDINDWFDQVGFEDNDEIDAFNNERFLRNWSIAREYLEKGDINKNTANYLIKYFGSIKPDDVNEVKVRAVVALLSELDEITDESYDAVIKGANTFIGVFKDEEDYNNFDKLLSFATEAMGHLQASDLFNEKNLSELLKTPYSLAAMNKVFTQLEKKEPGLTQERLNALLKSPHIKNKYMDDVLSVIDKMQQADIHLTGNKLTGKGKDNLVNLLAHQAKIGFVNEIIDILAQKEPGLTQERFDAILGQIDNIDEDNIEDIVSVIGKMQDYGIHLTGNKLTGTGKDNLSTLLANADEIVKINQILEVLTKEEPGITQDRLDVVIDNIENLYNVDDIVSVIEKMQEHKIHLTGNKLTGEGKDNLKNLFANPDKIGFVDEIIDVLNKKEPGLTQERFESIVFNMKIMNDNNINDLVGIIEKMQGNIHLTGDKLTGKGQDNLKNLFNHPDKFPYVHAILSVMEPINQHRYDAVMAKIDAINDKNINKVTQFIETLQANKTPLTKNDVLTHFIALKPDQQGAILKILDVLGAHNADPKNFHAIVNNMQTIMDHPEKVDALCKKIGEVYAEGKQLEPSWFDKLLKKLFDVPLPIEKLFAAPKSTQDPNGNQVLSSLESDKEIPLQPLSSTYSGYESDSDSRFDSSSDNKL